MSKILLIDIDSKIPNLALKKVEKYFKDNGDEVIWNQELFATIADQIFISCVFDWNKNKAREFEIYENVMIGGSGYDLSKTLPIEIEKIKPKINLGFTTRGCIRKCPFCIVPLKEGMIRIEGDIYDLWDRKSRQVMLLDNNILALPEHFKLIASQLRKENLRVDFNQGLDHRLLTDEITKELLSLSHIREIRFAFDDISYKPTVLRALKLLKLHGLKDWGSRWYIYIGEKDTFDTVFERINILRKHKQAVYVMRDKTIYNKPWIMALANYGNTIGLFKKTDFETALNTSDRLKQYRNYKHE